MASLGEFTIALQFRDTLQKLISTEIANQRPPLRYATVDSIDRVNRKCMVIYPGETVPVKVSMGSVQPANTGLVVRIDGLLGDRFISDVLGPIFTDTPSLEGPVVIYSGDPVVVPLRVRGMVGQTADLQYWTDSNDTVKARITTGGIVYAYGYSGGTVVGDNLKTQNGKVFYSTDVSNNDLIRFDDTANRYHFIADGATEGVTGNAALQAGELYYTSGMSATHMRNVGWVIRGGGNINPTGSHFDWQERFIVIGAGKGASLSTDGYFEINMPADGTVITGINGHANVTVGASNAGTIQFVNTWDTLWYALPIGQGAATVNSNFYISNYNTTDFEIPPHWVMIAQRGDGVKSPRWMTCVGEVDYWRVPTLGSSWTDYSASFDGAAYRVQNGYVQCKGLVKGGTSGTMFTFPAGFRPSNVLLFLGHASGGVADIRVNASGALWVSGYLAGGTNGDVSLSQVHFKAEL